MKTPRIQAKTPQPQGYGASLGVADGARTRDVLDHNQVLYQLNYSHHCRTDRCNEC